MKHLLRATITVFCMLLLLPETSEAQFFPHNDSTFAFVSTTNSFGRIQTYDGEDGRWDTADDKMIDRFYQLVGLNSNYVWNPNNDPDINILDERYFEGDDSLMYFRELIMDNSFRSNPPIDINVTTLVRMFKDEKYGLARFGVTNVESTTQNFLFSVLLRARIFNVFGGETLEYDAALNRVYIFNSNGAVGIQPLDRDLVGVSLLDFSDYDSTDPIRDNARDFARWNEMVKTTFDPPTSVGADGGWAYLNFGPTGDLQRQENFGVWVAFTHGADLDEVDMRLDEAVAKFDEINTDTSIEDGYAGIPKTIELNQNYPNPFNPSTTISYSIPETGLVNLTVYNALGQKVATLVEGTQSAGNHTAQFDASRLNSGMYIYRLMVNGQSLSRTMMLVK